jgi:alginate biosynthesis protein AlgK
LRFGLPALALAGCAAMAATTAGALPDLARGRAAAERGDVAAAEADLVPLAERGYLEAQTRLARLYGAQDTPESSAKAVQWARIASEKDPSMRIVLARSLMRLGPAADPAEVEHLLQALAADNDGAARPLQLRLYRELPQLADPRQVAVIAQTVAASAVVEERTEAIAWYRANRDADPGYEQALVALCEKDRKAVEECYADLSRHFRKVGDVEGQKRLRKELVERFDEGKISDTTIERVARNLSADDQSGRADVPAAYALFLKIKEPSPTVTARKARLLIQQPALDPGAKPEEMLKDAYAKGSLEAALQLGRMYMDEFNPGADADRAAQLLNEALPAFPSAHVWIGRLYERGYYGLPDPKKALEHYLAAARVGNPNADFALARMYSVNRGIKVDPVLAYSFASIAQAAGHTGAAELATQLRSTMTDPQVARAQQIAHAETVARQAALALPQTDAARVAAVGEKNP